MLQILGINEDKCLCGVWTKRVSLSAVSSSGSTVFQEFDGVQGLKRHFKEAHEGRLCERLQQREHRVPVHLLHGGVVAACGALLGLGLECSGFEFVSARDTTAQGHTADLEGA